MRYTLEERLSIGQQIYDNEITKYAAADQYGINMDCARVYMRLYRDTNHLPPKNIREVRKCAKITKSYDAATLIELEEMTKEELIREVIKAKIAEARLKKGYEVKGDGSVILYDKKNTR